jgi:hypothetical protein
MKDIKIPYLPYIGFQESKDIAEKFLKAHGYLIEKTNNFLDLPVKVEILAAKSGHNIELIPDLQKEFGIKGMAYNNTSKKQFEIFIDSNHYFIETDSCPFTIAEELAHIILHSKIFDQIESIEDRIALETNSTESNHQVIEKQAKSVASELLLPTCLFLPYMDDWFIKNLSQIVDDRPMHENDLLDFIARKIWPDLGLSQYIIKRALIRNFNYTKIISDLVVKHKIKYLS